MESSNKNQEEDPLWLDYLDYKRLECKGKEVFYSFEEFKAIKNRKYSTIKPKKSKGMMSSIGSWFNKKLDKGVDALLPDLTGHDEYFEIIDPVPPSSGPGQSS